MRKVKRRKKKIKIFFYKDWSVEKSTGFIFLSFYSDFTYVKFEIRGLGAVPPTSVLWIFVSAKIPQKYANG